MPELSDFITAAELARREGRHRSYFATLADKGQIPDAIQVGRIWLIPKSYTPKPLPGPGQKGKRRKSDAA